MSARMNIDVISIHVQRLLNSYRHWTGTDLIERIGSAADQAHTLDLAPIVVLSQGTQADPLFNYGNRTALELWELDFETLTRMPSRHSAEPMHRDERARFMTQVRAEGFVRGYRGIRISRGGKRFLIEDALIWNVLDEKNDVCGQAASFNKWTYL